MIINRLDLFRCLQTVIKVVPKKGIVSTLAGVSLSARDNLLTMRGTDLETGMETQSVCQGEIQAVLPGKLLLEIVSKLSNDAVEIDIKGDVAEIKCGRSYYKLPATSSDNYPEFPKIESEPFIIPLAEFNQAIRKTIFATSQDETRGSLTGLCLNLTNKTLSATDGHKLSEIQNLSVAGEGQFILPFKTVKELSRINGGTYHVKVGEGQIEFTVESPQYIKLISRLIEGEFPNIDSVMPKEFDTILFFNRESFLDSLNRINIIKPQSVVFDVKNKALIAESADSGTAREEVEFWFEKEGRLEKFAFNPQFLIEPLNVMESGQAFIKANNEIEPMILQERDNEDWKYLFMPLRVRGEEE